MLQERIALTGNEAMALAMKQINPDVVAAYPITPQTEIVQLFSSYVANGMVKTEFVTVESEHSALSAVAVSYTHLDVYKRQGIGHVGRCRVAIYSLFEHIIDPFFSRIFWRAYQTIPAII